TGGGRLPRAAGDLAGAQRAPGPGPAAATLPGGAGERTDGGRGERCRCRGAAGGRPAIRPGKPRDLERRGPTALAANGRGPEAAGARVEPLGRARGRPCARRDPTLAGGRAGASRVALPRLAER